MLNEFKKIAIFNKVVECGSFTKAGQLLSLPKSKVSEQITALETILNVRLLHRTTRKINLTTEGCTFYHYSNGLNKVAEDAFRSVNHLSSEVSGIIRISTTIDFGTFILNPLIARFSAQYPNVVFDVDLNDAIESPVEENLDLVLRIGEMKNSSLVGRVLAPFMLGMYASQGYLNKTPLITTPEDIQHHSWISLSRTSLPNDVVTLRDQRGEKQQIRTHPKHVCNSPLGVMSMVREGMGVGLIASFLAEEINDPSLVRLFPDFYMQGLSVNILYPSRKNMPPRVRLFIDYLIETIKA
ncbi:LysR family transcriptional regulator [Marinomonas transparens]|uniref:LysR family transcriptional regulator n=1 Tax=Marinomonas transparens TaxID=2795388 RepID=A0A934JQ18_9GAMM|nr:LysR family transcriptional regulator [Marinomonas transparens]MBJ7539836.1 LysR family transcriptional regulator [Marinomonas transparens]